MFHGWVGRGHGGAGVGRGGGDPGGQWVGEYGSVGVQGVGG